MDENIKELYEFVCKKEKEYSKSAESGELDMNFGNWRAYHKVKEMMENIFIIDEEVI